MSDELSTTEVDAARTVWTAARDDERPADEPREGGDSPAYAHVHQARVENKGAADQLDGVEQVEPGVRCQFGRQQGGAERTPIVYQFDAAVFSEEAAKEWLTKHGVTEYQWQPDNRDRPLQASVAKPGAAAQEENASDRREPGEMRVRSFVLEPSTWDDATNSCLATICTDAAVFSTDLRTGRAVLEVWRQDGLEFDDHVPLIDNHNRATVRNVVGSVRDFQTGPHATSARLFVSTSEPDIATKIKEGHIKEVSAGGSPRETTAIPPGQSRSVRGESYRAHPEHALYVHTRFRIREVSLTPKAADGATQIRSLSIERTRHMHERIRKYLERLGLAATASEEDAKTFYDSLPEVTRAKADEKAKREEDDEDEDEDERDSERDDERDDERDEEEDRCDGGKGKGRKAARLERVRREAEAAGRRAELDRQNTIRKLGAGVPEELVARAINEGWTSERAAPEFLDAIRTRQTAAGGAGFSIHSRSHERDCTAEVLGAALSVRSLNQLSSNDAGYGQAANPVNLFGCYEPSDPLGRGNTDWTFRRNRAGSESHRKAVEQLLDRADRYAGLSIMDMVRECCRLDGANLSSWSPAETIRAAISGGSFGAIFTTSFNALFLAGYLDATDTTMGWTTESDMPNFLPGERATVGKMGQLTLDAPGKSADHMSYGDWNEPIRLHRFTGQYVIDEKDLINDRFGALQTWSPQELGLTARQLRPNLVYSTILNNPLLNQDGQQVFCAAHGNYLAAGAADLYNYRKSDNSLLNANDPAGAVYAEPLQRAISMISEQRMSGRPLNLRPRFMLMAPKLRWGAAILFQSAERVIATGSGGTFNPLRDLGVEPRDDARLNAVGCIDPLTNTAVSGKDYHWLLICRPGEEGAKTVEVAYLQGTGRAPQIRSFVLGGPGTPGRWGIGWDVKHDIGVSVIDFRGMFYGTTAV